MQEDGDKIIPERLSSCKNGLKLLTKLTGMLLSCLVETTLINPLRPSDALINQAIIDSDKGASHPWHNTII